MAESDALRGFDFSSFGGGGLFLKFQAGKPVTLRVLTTDPIVTTKEFEGSDGEVNLSTQFSFIVYNFTDSKAQILSASPGVARKIGELHVDEDFGADIRKIDIKISPTGEKLTRKYDIQVLPKTNTLTTEQIKECAAIKLDEAVKDGDRMSLYDPEKVKAEPKAVPANGGDDEEVEVDTDEPIDLSDIPF